MKDKVIKSSLVFTSIEDRVDYNVLNKVVSNSNYELGNPSELEGIKDFFTKTIVENTQGPNYYSITVKKSVDLKTLDSIVEKLEELLKK